MFNTVANLIGVLISVLLSVAKRLFVLGLIGALVVITTLVTMTLLIVHFIN